jgi:hypothetical protein
VSQDIAAGRAGRSTRALSTATPARLGRHFRARAALFLVSGIGARCRNCLAFTPYRQRVPRAISKG